MEGTQKWATGRAKTLAEGCSGVRARRIPMRTVLRRPADSPHSSSTRYSRRCTSIWEGGAGGGSGGGEREEGIHVSRERRCPRARGRRVGAECARGRKVKPVDCRRLGCGLTCSAHCRSSCRQRGGTSQQPPSRPGPAPHCAAAGLAKAPWKMEDDLFMSRIKEKGFQRCRSIELICISSLHCRCVHTLAHSAAFDERTLTSVL